MKHNLPKVLVCGGRRYSNNRSMWDALDALHKEIGDFVVICGDASGADRLAITWARERELPFRGYPARWTHEGIAAGIRRNQYMIDDAPIDVIVAFLGGNGTCDMMKRAKGIRLIEVPAKWSIAT